MSIALRALRAPAPRLTALVLTSILSLLSVAWLVPWAHAQSESSLPTEDARWQRMVAAGPYSVVNTGTGTMITTIPLVHLSGPGGTALDFTLYNTSTGVSVSSIGQIARGWRFTYDDWIYTAQQPNLSLYAQENSAGGGLQEWYRANNGVPFSRENGVRDDLTADPNGFYFTVQRKDQTTARYDQYRGNGYCLRSTTDTHGNTVSLSYDGLGRVSTIMDAGGRMLTLGWNPNDQFTLSSLTLNAGGNSRVWNFTTDANSCLTAITYPAPTTGGARPVLNLTPDGAGRITDLYDLNGNHWNYSYYTPAGGPTVIWNVTDPYSGLATNFNLLLSGPNRTMTITDQAGRQTVHQYTGTSSLSYFGVTNFLISKETDPLVSGDAAAYYATYTWNTDGTLASLVDRRGDTWRYTWDTNNYGDMLTETDPSMNPGIQPTVYKYNGFHKPVSKIDPVGFRTIWTYDGVTGDLTEQVVDPKTDPTDPSYSKPSGLAISHSYTYYPSGDLNQEAVGADPPTVYSNYDAYGNAWTVTDPMGKAFSATFDAFGNKLSATEPAPGGTTSFTYDQWNRLTKTTHPDSNYVQITYDNMGGRTAVRDENGHYTYTDFDVLNRPWRTRREVSAAQYLVTSFHFNNVGDRDQATSPNGHTSDYTFDARHHLIQVQYPDNTYRKFHYDGNGNRDKRWDGLNYLTVYTYDPVNRLSNIHYPTGADTSYSYYDNGLRSGMTDPTGTYWWHYYGTGQIYQWYQPVPTETITYTYEAGTGRKLTTQLHLGQTWTYGYDSDGRVSSVNFGNVLTGTYGYFDNGQLASVLKGNNTQALFTYDSRDRLSQIQHQNGVGGTWSTIEQLGYTPDAASNVTQITDFNSPEGINFTQTFGYDHANRLTSESRTGGVQLEPAGDDALVWNLDGDGNLASYQVNGAPAVSFSLDANDKLLSGSGYSFTYNNNGDPTSFSDSTAGTSQTYTYDYENQLASIVYSNGTPTSYFWYNGDFERVQKQDSQGKRQYIRDLDGTVLAELDPSTGLIPVYYVPGLGFYLGITSQAFYDMTDALGSTTGVQDASQSRVDWYWYQAYGNTSVYRQDQYTPHKWVGKLGYYSDGDSGMELLGRRYYLPTLHRFLTQDPMGHAAGLNLYQYADNNPLSNVDPTGLDTSHEPLFPTKGTWETLGSHVHIFGRTLENAGYNLDSLFDWGARVGANTLNNITSVLQMPVGMIQHLEDYPTRNTKNYTYWAKSEGEARTIARGKLGSDPVEVAPNKWRSVNGKWQYRAKPGDFQQGHIHIEELNPRTGEVKQNYHIRWKPGTGRGE